VAQLIVSRDGRVEGSIELLGRAMRVGRDPSNDIVLPDPAKHVSRFHAEVQPSGDGYSIQDLGTPNGLRVDGAPVSNLRLEPGRGVKIGPYTLEYSPGAGDARDDEDDGSRTIFVPPRPEHEVVPAVLPPAKGPVLPVPTWPRGRRQAVVFGLAVVVAIVLGLVSASRSAAVAKGPEPPIVTERPLPAPDPPPPAAAADQILDQVAKLLADAESQINSRDYPAALSTLRGLQRIDPQNAALPELRRRIPSSPPRSQSGAIVTSSPRDQHIPCFPAEPPAVCQGRIELIRGNYQEADDARRAQNWPVVRARLEAVHRDQKGPYLESAVWLAELNRNRDSALAEARRAEKWNDVLTWLERWARFEPGADGQAVRSEILARHRADALVLFDRASVLLNSEETAKAMVDFARVVDMLPPGEDLYGKASAQLDRQKVGGSSTPPRPR
jgi:hypothetical protein